MRFASRGFASRRSVLMIAATFAAVASLTLSVRPAAADDAAAPAATQPASGDVFGFVVKDIDGKDIKLDQYKGKVLLIVNTASKCGFTPQYEGLEKLYSEHKDAGLVVIGFPANNFNSQEPGSDDAIKAFCTDTYHVTFPMMSKISVKGADKAPLFKYLTEPASVGDKASEVGWNFNKFLIGKDGKLIAHYVSKVKPDDAALVDALKSALAS